MSNRAFPADNPNPKTRNPVPTHTDWKVAHQTVFHDGTKLQATLLVVLSTD